MMEIQDEFINDIDLTPIQRFYSNTRILITGATGFLGTILLEKLLRCCPTISTIYIIIRNKKGKDMNTRVDELFDNIVFENLKQQCPKFREKVVGVKGDCSLRKLGMSGQERQMLIDNVNMVFHVAATVRFDETITKAMAINVQATLDLVEMTTEMKNLKCFMYVSTTYSNSFQEIIEEKLYPPPMDYEKLIKVVENVPEKLLSDMTKKLLGKWPNTYTFTKSVAENIVATKTEGLPVAIFRPAIVISTYKEPIPGWINNIHGPTGIIAGFYTGIMRTVLIDLTMKSNLIPCDMCINSLISAAWEVGTNFESNKERKRRKEDIPVYHYESNSDKPVTWKQYVETCVNVGVHYPPSKAVWYHNLTLVTNEYIYWLARVFFHLLPAFIFDIVLFCIGKQPMFLRIYEKIDKVLPLMFHFMLTELKFNSSRVQSLINRMSKMDKKIFFCDLKDLDWTNYFQDYIIGVRVYILKDSLENLEYAKVQYKRLWYLDRALKLTVILITIRILWAFTSYFNGIFSS